MDDNYLDKKFKDILESGSEFEPDAAALSDMQKRLATLQPKQKRRYGLPILLLLLFLLLSSGLGFFYNKYVTMQQQLVELDKQFTEITRIDSVIEQHIIYKIDTIYEVVYRDKYVDDKRRISNEFSNFIEPSSFYHSSTPRPGQLLSQLSDQISSWSPAHNGLSLLGHSSGSSFYNKNNTQEFEVIESQKYTDLLSPLSGSSLKMLALGNSTKLDSLSKANYDFLETRKREINPIYYFIPTGFTAELNVSPLVLPSLDYEGMGYGFGITAAIELPQNRAIEVAAESLIMDFEAKDPNQFSTFPILDPKDPTDILHELKGNFSYLQIPVMIRQRMFPNRKFQPVISLGLVAYRPLQQRLIYEYIDGTDEYTLENTFKNGSFSVDNLRVALGFEYSLGKHFSIEPRAQYQHGFSLNANEYFNLQYWAFNMGINYKFKK